MKSNLCLLLKPDPDDLSNLNNLKIVSNQYTLFDSLHFIHSDCGSSAVQTSANKQTLLEEKYCG